MRTEPAAVRRCEHRIEKADLLCEISNLAYVAADVSEGKEDPHTLHQTYDICEAGNIGRVESMMRLAAVQAGAVVAEAGRLIMTDDAVILRIRGVPKYLTDKIVGETREFMTASVLHGWLSVTLPSAAGFWQTRKEELLAELSETVGAATLPMRAFPRRLPPI